MIRRSIEFRLLSNIEIELARKEERRLNNLYNLEIPSAWPPLKTEAGETLDSEAEQPDKSPVEVIEDAFQEEIEHGR